MLETQDREIDLSVNLIKKKKKKKNGTLDVHKSCNVSTFQYRCTIRRSIQRRWNFRVRADCDITS